MPHPLDTLDMETIIRHWPEQFSAGISAAGSVALPGGGFRQVLLAGMGGSWMAAAVLRDAGLVAVPLRIHRNYALPAVDQDTLVVAYSFSGNTEETLSAYDAARAAGLPLVGVSFGGQLQQRCQRDGVPHVCIPADPPHMQPRSATGYGIGILLRLLSRLSLTVPGAEAMLLRAVERLQTFMPAARQQGRQIAQELYGQTPVVYSAPAMATVARIWKIKLNENAKTPAFWNVFPELNHNEMIGWTRRFGPFRLVMLLDAEDDPRILARFRITQQILAEHGLQTTVFNVPEGSLPEKLLSTLLVGDWASYELALLVGVDPSPVQLVEEFKLRMRNQVAGG